MASVHHRDTADGLGSYQCRWTADDGRQRSKSFRIAGPGVRARQAAEREAAAFARAVERGAAEPDGAGLTVAALVDKWLAARAPRVEPSSLLKYRAVAAHFADLAALRLGKVTPLHVERWLSDQRASGCAPATLHDRFAQLKTVFKQAVRWRLIPWNPCDGVEAPPAGEGRKRVLAPAEVRAVVAAAEGARDRAAFALLAGSGCRAGELVAVRWADLDLSDETPAVHLRATLQRTVDGQRLREATKTGGARRVALDAATAEALRAWRREVVALLDRAGLPFEPAGWAFAVRPGGPMPSAAWFAERLGAACVRAGVPKAGPHVFRHSHATALIQAGVSPHVVAERLGHQHLVTTAGYVHPGLEDQRRALELLARSSG